MFKPKALKAGTMVIPFEQVTKIDIGNLETHGFVNIYQGDRAYRADGFDAIEAIMAFKPSAVEGLRLKWPKNAWAFHNMVGHPLMQILAWMGMKRLAIKLHDVTTPVPR